MITITTIYPGASADLIQGFITAPIAKRSRPPRASTTSPRRAALRQPVSVHMRLNTDPDAALTEVIAKVQQVRGTACRRTPRTRSSSKGTGQSFALMYLAVRSDRT